MQKSTSAKVAMSTGWWDLRAVTCPVRRVCIHAKVYVSKSGDVNGMVGPTGGHVSRKRSVHTCKSLRQQKWRCQRDGGAYERSRVP
ncbi:hypothetical protein BaRGS_00007523 [Batillaria attramentaria]|uniref:Uncharacterized protein n=1 Tax=Batillaria attramentaria TaxID=370345 RepID=A0ABD0LNI0_9CAEN